MDKPSSAAAQVAAQIGIALTAVAAGNADDLVTVLLL